MKNQPMTGKICMWIGFLGLVILISVLSWFYAVVLLLQIPYTGLLGLPLFLVLFVFLLILKYGRARSEREGRITNDQHFQILAQELGLQYMVSKDASPLVSGVLQGYAVEFYMDAVKAANSKVFFPFFRISCLQPTHKIALQINPPYGNLWLLFFASILVLPAFPFFLYHLWQQTKRNVNKVDVIVTNNAGFTQYLFNDKLFSSLWKTVRSSKAGQPSGEIKEGALCCRFNNFALLGFITHDYQRKALRNSFLAGIELVRCLDEFNKCV